MDGAGYWIGMLTGDEDHVSSLEDFTLPNTQETQLNHDLPFESAELDIQVQQSQGVERPLQAKGMAKRTKNFDLKEDETLCSAWLNVSKDPINGADQKHSTFWSRVHAYFDEKKTTTAVRTVSSLMHRWLTIQFQVNKFCSSYESIERRNQSGKTIQDKISDALELYKQLDKDKKSFTLIPCWNKLKGEDKWKARRVELLEQEKLAAAKKKQKVNIDLTPRNVQAAITEDLIENAAPESGQRKRPQGAKMAKEALKRGGGESCMEALDKMWAKKEAFDKEREEKRDKKKEERFLVSLELEKNRMAIEAKRAGAELMKEEKEVMLMDMSSLTPLQKQYYEMMQQKIIDRRLAN